MSNHDKGNAVAKRETLEATNVRVLPRQTDAAAVAVRAEAERIRQDMDREARGFGWI